MFEAGAERLKGIKAAKASKQRIKKKELYTGMNPVKELNIELCGRDEVKKGDLLGSW